MCFGGSKQSQPTPPPPAPPPAEPTASVAQAAPKTDTSSNDSTTVQRTGRRALRIDTTTPSASGGAGLNIPV